MKSIEDLPLFRDPLAGVPALQGEERSYGYARAVSYALEIHYEMKLGGDRPVTVHLVPRTVRHKGKGWIITPGMSKYVRRWSRNVALFGTVDLGSNTRPVCITEFEGWAYFSEVESRWENTLNGTPLEDGQFVRQTVDFPRPIVEIPDGFVWPYFTRADLRYQLSEQQRRRVEELRRSPEPRPTSGAAEAA